MQLVLSELALRKVHKKILQKKIIIKMESKLLNILYLSLVLSSAGGNIFVLLIENNFE